MKRESTGSLLSTVFVDYDNIYLSLKRKNEDAAKRFAKDSGSWLQEIASGRLMTATNGPALDVPRRIVMNRCYGNSVPRRNTQDNATDMNSFPFVRHHFVRAGFEVIDCPPLTAQLKNSADIRMVMDVRDYLIHDTYFDEFVILSGDADFTPVLHRLRQHARRTVVYANDYTAAPYRAISDAEVREDDLIRFLLDGQVAPQIDSQATEARGLPSPAALAQSRKDIIGEVLSAVRSAPQPVPLEALADRAVRVLGHDKTVGLAWGGAGSFRDLLSAGLPENIKLSDAAPYFVYDTGRQAPPSEARAPKRDPEHAAAGLIAENQRLGELPGRAELAVEPSPVAAQPRREPQAEPAPQRARLPSLGDERPGMDPRQAPAARSGEVAPRNEVAARSPVQPQQPKPRPQAYADDPFDVPRRPVPQPDYADQSRQMPLQSGRSEQPAQQDRAGASSQAVALSSHAPQQMEVREQQRAPQQHSAPVHAQPQTQVQAPAAALRQEAPRSEPVQQQPKAPQSRAPQAASPAPGTSAPELQQSIARIHEACQAPPLSPPEYRVLFEVMSEEINENGLTGSATLVNIAQRAQEHGVEIRRDDARFVLEVVSEADPWFEQGASANLFASRFRNFVVARCRSQGMTLSANELDLIEAWFSATAAARKPRVEAPQRSERAEAPAITAQPTSYGASPAGYDASPVNGYQDRDAFGGPDGNDDDEFPRIVRSQMRG